MDRDKLGGMFDKYLLLSPNIFVDPQYETLIEYVQKTTGQKKEDFCFEEFDQEAIRKLMEEETPKRQMPIYGKLGQGGCCLHA